MFNFFQNIKRRMQRPANRFITMFVNKFQSRKLIQGKNYFQNFSLGNSRKIYQELVNHCLQKCTAVSERIVNKLSAIQTQARNMQGNPYILVKARNIQGNSYILVKAWSKGTLKSLLCGLKIKYYKTLIIRMNLKDIFFRYKNENFSALLLRQIKGQRYCCESMNGGLL